jgi:hypothetical protein
MKLVLMIWGTDDKERQCVAEFVDFVKYEEQHNISMSKVEQDIKVRDLAWLAWHSEKRRGNTQLNFDQWLETVSNISLDTGEGRIVPLEMTQPTG